MLSLVFLIAGGIQFSGYRWLHTIYLMLLIPSAVFFPPGIVIPLGFTVPFLEIRHFIETDNISEELSLNLAVILSVVVVSLFVNALNKKKDILESQLVSLRKNAAEVAHAPEVDLGDDAVMSQYLSSMSMADEEIKEILLTIKYSMLADSVNLFTPYNDDLKLRSSTEDSQNIIPSGKGLIMLCFKEKRTIISSNVSEKGYEVGYLKRGEIASFIALPVIDGSFMLGVLTCDTSRFSAFGDADANTLKLFSKQIIRIFHRERVYPQIQRSHAGLRVLHEESSKLASSLKIEVLAQRIIGSGYRIAPSSIIFLLKKGDIFEVVQHTGNLQVEKRAIALSGTLLDMAGKNMEPLYLSDVRNYSLPLMPFRTKDVSSVLILPLMYEKEFIGMLVFLSEKIGAFNPHQIELLEVLGTQASISIANARLHAKIERMATTDGLTGLYNHRHFHERLSGEIRRLDRFPEPLSLMLMDIDYFKKVNDTYGHPAGDKILHGVAGILKAALRSIDVPARYGGEEFAAILPGTDSKGAKNIAERLRKTVMDHPFSVDGKTVKVTVSIGISTASISSKNKEELIERADQALYHAKKNGRNRSVIWDEIKG